MPYSLRFADIEVLRYSVPGFSDLPLRTKRLLYELSEAALYGHKLAWYQNGVYGVGTCSALDLALLAQEKRGEADPRLREYVRRIRFAKGMHHHYSQDKLTPTFTATELRRWLLDVGLALSKDVQQLLYNPRCKPKRVSLAGPDPLANSSCTFYEKGITADKARAFYQQPGHHPLNSNLKRGYPTFYEEVWRIQEPGGFGPYLQRVCQHLEAARQFAPPGMAESLRLLIQYYHSGSPADWEAYCRAWVVDNALGECGVDLINGFVEVYNDPLGLKGTYEGLVELLDAEATARAQLIAREAAWYEQHSPAQPRHRKERVQGVTMTVVNAVCLAGDCYPASPIGVNLPNDDAIRESVGSKSVVLRNISLARLRSDLQARRTVADEFAPDDEERQRARQHGEEADELHTALHECLGHGSGQMEPGVTLDALGPYGSTLEEARADLYALYFLPDQHMIDTGAMSSPDVARAAYESYLRTGALTQLARVQPGRQIEEAHMRNRALIAHWVLRHGPDAAQLITRNGKHHTHVVDHQRLRELFGELLREVQRIKSQGDRQAAEALVETYGVSVDPKLHEEVLQRWATLDRAPFTGFVNPRLTPVMSGDEVVDVELQEEDFDEQARRYERIYG